MENPQFSPLLWTLLGSWAVVTIIWIILLIYRGSLETREDDHLILDAAEERMASDQRAIMAQLIRLGRPIMILGIASGALLLLSIVVWLWQSFQSF